MSSSSSSNANGTTATAPSLPHQHDHLALLDQLCVFLNAYLALNHDNRLAIIGATSHTSKFLFPGIQPPAIEEHIARSNAYQQFYSMNSTLVGGVKRLMQDEVAAAAAVAVQDPTSGGQSCHLSSALSKALCYANRHATASTDAKPSILVISASPDSPSHYVPLMNAIFSAQKAEINLDACKLYGDSVFLQQAAHLTHGVYRCLPGPEGMIQHLLFTYLPPPELRSSLNLPAPTKVDFRAACFCHRRMTSDAFVCSVCLAIYCQWRPVCETCKTKFPFQQRR
ncbi:TFIIH subunit Tfb4/p34 [Catenaria anguillulae PL171]|uniref:General transcription and DNA repair factor IIH subunit TFB4 n=1 Tax=Catenaria anguillulae PL171 TaxID=765915 RepID=A0A1Y2H9F1_9FUNG|nr:TFIIH subunit Tfb4/p34 [Catenaria anguillulae PL171]